MTDIFNPVLISVPVSVVIHGFWVVHGTQRAVLCCRYTGVARHKTGEGFVNPLPAEKGERQAESWALLCLYGLVGLLLHQIILPEGIQMDVFGNTAISLETDWSVTASTNSNFNSSWNVWTLSVWSFLMVCLSHWVKGMLFLTEHEPQMPQIVAEDKTEAVLLITLFWHQMQYEMQIDICVVSCHTVMLIPLSPPPADSIWQAQSFNLGTAGAKIFSGTAKEEFGYTVQQMENNQGKWYEFLSSHKKKLLESKRFQCHRHIFLSLMFYNKNIKLL